MTDPYAPESSLMAPDEEDRLQERVKELEAECATLRALAEAQEIRKATCCMRMEEERDGLESVLTRNGFRRCDIAACNCGSWHPGPNLRAEKAEAELAQTKEALESVTAHKAKLDEMYERECLTLGQIEMDYRAAHQRALEWEQKYTWEKEHSKALEENRDAIAAQRDALGAGHSTDCALLTLRTECDCGAKP